LIEFYKQIENSWKFIDYDDFNDGDIGLRRINGYVGLKNFGCTCYMNSLLQNLFMISDLRNYILSVDLKDQIKEQEQLDQNLLY